MNFSFLIPLVLFGIPSAALWIASYNMHKKRKTSPGPQRVQVTAYVVDYKHYRQPQRITFDYPLPDGTWRREQRNVLFSPAPVTGNTVVPGTPFSVYVNPANPLDVSLGASNAVNGFYILLPLLASMFTLFAIFSTLFMLIYSL